MITPPIDFDAERDTRFAHQQPDLDRVLHVFHAGWHGIRSATAALPGHKLAIPHEGTWEGESLRYIAGLISRYGITTLCFQAFSARAEELALTLKRQYASDLRMYVVTHLTASQYENPFEMEMQRRINRLVQTGVLARQGSVKPGFDVVVPEVWSKTIYNCAHDVGSLPASTTTDDTAVFVPLENTWRKNLHANVIAASRSDLVEAVYTVNWPTGLESVTDLGKVRLVGYKRGTELLATMGSVGTVMVATLADSQPMTQLEALACGTPCITGPLRLPEFRDSEFERLFEVEACDNPTEIKRRLDEVLQLRRKDGPALAEMLANHLDKRLQLSQERYLEFLEL